MSQITPPENPGAAGPVQAVASPYADQRAGLLAFGVVTVLLGLLSSCMATCIPLMVFMPRLMLPGAGAGAGPGPGVMPPGTQPFDLPAAGPDVGNAVMFLLGGAAGAVGLIWVGWGTLKLRRWSRPLQLVWAWLALINGASCLLMIPALVRQVSMTMEAITTQPADQPAMGPAFVGGEMAFAGIAMMLLGGVYVAFFQRRDVRLTLEHYDTQPRWTDRRPLPVLGLAVALASGVLGVMMIGGAPSFPVMGLEVTQPLLAFLTVATVAIMFSLAWLAWRQHPLAWWGAAAVVVVGAIDVMLTALHPAATMATTALSAGLQLTPGQLEALRHVEDSTGMLYLLSRALWVVVGAGYLVYVRRYFMRSAA